ncbi:MAG: glycosyltransferase family 4 protein [Bacteroidota bacterium]|nr:glycosyltransferase family 4 protein [Bacteroidota bacterium]
MLLAENLLIPNKEIFEKAKLQIAIEVQRVFRPRKHGMDVVAQELVKRLPLGTDTIDYHVMVKDDSDRCLTSIPHRLVHTIRKAPYFIWEQYFLPRACHKLKADILHCTANTAPLSNKMPLILTLHDVIFLEKSNIRAKASWYQRLGNLYRSIIVSTIAKKALRIITVSEFQKKLIVEKLQIPAEKVKVIYNGADERFFDHYSQEQIDGILEKFGLTRGYIFFMANTDARKNSKGVVNAYAQLLLHNPEAPRLVMKGLKKEQLQQLLKQEKLEWLEKEIDLIGYVGYIDLPAIYQAASMLWFPSFSEGFGLPIVEAMASGIPVITSSVSCMPEIAGDAALFIDPKNPTSLAFATQLILTDSELAERLSANGKKRAALFTWDSAIKETVAVYHEVETMIEQ